MDFGITFKGDIEIDRTLALAQQAEAAGFGYGWIFDSHVLWPEPYPVLTLLASNTRRMRLGTLVTNPVVRDITVTASLFATLNLISSGRMELGIGRGDSSRRVLGKKPTTLAKLEESVRMFRALTTGQEASWDGTPVRFTWVNGTGPRVWIAGYGPKVLRLAGRVADGIILQFADPDLIDWCLSFARQGAEEAGRDFKKVQVMAAAPVWMDGNLEKCRQHVRWFPALVSNHVVDLVSRYDPKELPEALTHYVRERAGYDYNHHCEVESSNAEFVSDEVTDRFCVIGTADAHRQRLETLRRVGVTQFNIYLMSGEEEKTLEQYKKEIISHLAKK